MISILQYCERLFSYLESLIIVQSRSLTARLTSLTSLTSLPWPRIIISPIDGSNACGLASLSHYLFHLQVINRLAALLLKLNFELVVIGLRLFPCYVRVVVLLWLKQYSAVVCAITHN